MVFGMVAAGPSMSPTDQWRFLVDLVETFRKEFRDRVDGMQDEAKADRHQLRGELQAGLGKLSVEAAETRKDLAAIKESVIIIQTERRVEAGALQRKAGWIALVVTLGGGFMLRLLEKWLTVK